MCELLYKFESIMVLQTIIDHVDLNFLDKSDLENIEEIAYDLDIELTEFNIEGLYNSQYEAIEHIYNTWQNDVNEIYHEVRNGLLKILKGD